MVSLASPLIGAWLASVGYGLLFALSAAIHLAVLVVLRWWVKEPRWFNSYSAPGQV
jgi:hypothetical protein